MDVKKEDNGEAYIPHSEIRWFARTQVRLVVGPASRASLREAGASGARMVVVRAGKSFPEQEASDADAEHIGQLVEVRETIGVVLAVDA